MSPIAFTTHMWPLLLTIIASDLQDKLVQTKKTKCEEISCITRVVRLLICSVICLLRVTWSYRQLFHAVGNAFVLSSWTYFSVFLLCGRVQIYVLWCLSISMCYSFIIMIILCVYSLHLFYSSVLLLSILLFNVGVYAVYKLMQISNDADLTYQK